MKEAPPVTRTFLFVPDDAPPLLAWARLSSMIATKRCSSFTLAYFSGCFPCAHAHLQPAGPDRREDAGSRRRPPRDRRDRRPGRSRDAPRCGPRRSSRSDGEDRAAGRESRIELAGHHHAFEPSAHRDDVHIARRHDVRNLARPDETEESERSADAARFGLRARRGCAPSPTNTKPDVFVAQNLRRLQQGAPRAVKTQVARRAARRREIRSEFRRTIADRSARAAGAGSEGAVAHDDARGPARRPWQECGRACRRPERSRARLAEARGDAGAPSASIHDSRADDVAAHSHVRIQIADVVDEWDAR